MNIRPDANILLVRPDKIGDLILTLPAVESFSRRFSAARITFLCRSYTAPLLAHHPAVHNVIRADELTFSALTGEIKRGKFNLAVHFYVEPRTVAAVWCAGVPVRVGPFSKLVSLLLNNRVSQQRSRVDKHEAEYNLDLAKYCGADGTAAPPRIFLTESERGDGRELVAKLGFGPDARPVAIHSGSAGSVQNWPLEHFFRLGQKISNAGTPVVFTFGDREQDLPEKFRRFMGDSHKNIRSVQPGQLALRELASLISNCRAMISNSTGPLHIASALGVPTLSFYPHLPKVTSAKRWGPFGNPSKNKILSPDEETAPMSTITVERAYTSFTQLMI